MTRALRLHSVEPDPGTSTSTGPVGDSGTVDAPPEHRRASVRSAPLPTTGLHPPLYAVVSAHGGAGASTLAQWWAPAADCGQQWPGSTQTTQRVVVAARTCMPGLIAAADRLREWRANLTPAGVSVVALVLTPIRPGRVPSEVRRYRDTITALADDVFEVAWHDELIATELEELASCAPYDPAPQRRMPLTDAVPLDVYQTGRAIAQSIARAGKSANRNLN